MTVGAVALIAATTAVIAFADPFGGPAADSSASRSSFGEQIGLPLTGHTETLSSVAYGQVGGRPVAVSGGKDRTVRVWDLTDHRQLGGPLTGHTSEVLSLTATFRTGRWRSPVARTRPCGSGT